MKIAFIVNIFPCLSETFILNQITGLMDRGYEVDIYANNPGNAPILHEDIEKYGLLKHTFYHGKLRRNMPANKILRIIRAVSLINKNFYKKPVSLMKSLNFMKFGREAATLNVLYKIIPFLDIDTYDIVHCHFGPNGNFGALLGEVGLIKGKFLTTFYGYDFSGYVKEFGERVYDPLFERCDMVFVLCEKMKNQLIQLGCGENKIAVHRLGIDTNKFSFYPRHKRDNGKVYLLTIARLVEKKGLEYGIRAIGKVLQKFPQIEYKIVGDGILKNDLEMLITELGVRDRVKLIGWKSQEEIVDILNDADILLAPSVTAKDGDQEGTPTVLIEALARGLPVLSTHHSGIPEVVEDGKSGFLVPERDVDALAEKITYLINHSKVWPEMGKAGRNFIEKHYDINKLNDQLVSEYKNLLNDGIR